MCYFSDKTSDHLGYRKLNESRSARLAEMYITYGHWLLRWLIPAMWKKFWDSYLKIRDKKSKFRDSYLELTISKFRDNYLEILTFYLEILR